MAFPDPDRIALEFFAPQGDANPLPSVKSATRVPRVATVDTEAGGSARFGDVVGTAQAMEVAAFSMRQ
jgi:hypothetical protein